MEYRIPRDRVVGATLSDTPLIGKLVWLDFRLPNGTPRRFLLRLKDPQAFLAALKK